MASDGKCPIPVHMPIIGSFHCTTFATLVKFISRNFIPLFAIVNEIVFIISFLFLFSFLMYRNTIAFVCWFFTLQSYRIYSRFRKIYEFVSSYFKDFNFTLSSGFIFQLFINNLNYFLISIN